MPPPPAAATPTLAATAMAAAATAAAAVVGKAAAVTEVVEKAAEGSPAVELQGSETLLAPRGVGVLRLLPSRVVEERHYSSSERRGAQSSLAA